MKKKKPKYSLFKDIFNHQDKLLELYNALKGTDYSDAQAVDIIDLKDISPECERNTLAFILNNHLVIIENLFEVNASASLRMASLAKRIYKEIRDGSMNAKYKTHLRDIMKNTEIIVLYSGKEDYPAESTFRISDLLNKSGGGDHPA